MMTPTSTKGNINTFTEFRQAVYTRIFQKRRDALFDTLDALLSGGTSASFAYPSQGERFQRQWLSLYAAVEDGQIDTAALCQLLVKQLPQKGIRVFPLDSSSWPRPRSRVSEDLQCVYQASSNVGGGNVTVGYPYSLLEVLAQARQTRLDALDIAAADGKYSNVRFLSAASGLWVGIVARLRSDRVLYRPPKPTLRKRGPPPKYGKRFSFKDEQTWSEPDEIQEFQDEHYSKVRLKRRNSLCDKHAPKLTFDVLRAETHLEKDKPPTAVWFVWLPPVQLPASIVFTAQIIWTAYINRWPIELAIRFRKETLGWTLPRFQSAQTGDTWTQLVALAHWMLFLARPPVQDNPLPWQKAQTCLTPQRVRRSLWTIFLQIGTTTQPPKLRGKSPGWPKGKPRTPKERHKVVKKGVSAAKTA